MFYDGSEVTHGPNTNHRFSFRDAAPVMAALDRFGFAAEAAEVLRSYPEGREAQHPDGAALRALAEHWRLTGDRSCIDTALVAGAVGRIERQRHATRRRPFDHLYGDDFWSLRGLLDGAALLRT